jgi:hypothetical protein
LTLTGTMTYQLSWNLLGPGTSVAESLSGSLGSLEAPGITEMESGTDMAAIVRSVWSDTASGSATLVESDFSDNLDTAVLGGATTTESEWWAGLNLPAEEYSWDDHSQRTTLGSSGGNSDAGPISQTERSRLLPPFTWESDFQTATRTCNSFTGTMTLTDMDHAGIKAGPIFRPRAGPRGKKLAERPFDPATMHRPILSHLQRSPGAALEAVGENDQPRKR